jgi:hypothetical protein
MMAESRRLIEERKEWTEGTKIDAGEGRVSA